MAKVLEERRSETNSRFEKLQAELGAAEKLAAEKACVYATGSFGRGEASKYSDLDLFIVGRGEKNRRELSKLEEICIEADLIEVTQKLRIPEFSGDGEYLVHYTGQELIETLGKPHDDTTNTFTARLLLLLESKPILGETIYDKTIADVVAAYWRDYPDHKNEFSPAFLANDILRLWRTFCVNYEARTSTEPEEKRAKRKLTAVEEIPVIVIPNEAGRSWVGGGEGSPRSDCVCEMAAFANVLRLDHEQSHAAALHWRYQRPHPPRIRAHASAGARLY